MTISAVAARQKSHMVCESGTTRSSHFAEHEPEWRPARQLDLSPRCETERGVVREVVPVRGVEIGRDAESIGARECLREQRAADPTALRVRRDGEHPDEEMRLLR